MAGIFKMATRLGKRPRDPSPIATDLKRRTTSVVATFLYFGLCFIKETLRLLYPQILRVELGDSHVFDGDSLQKWEALNNVIADDMVLLKDVKSSKMFKAAGVFVYIVKLKAYVYEHNTHASFSNVQYSRLRQCIEPRITTPRVLRCTSHTHHNALKPFFNDDEVLAECLSELNGTQKTSMADLYAKVCTKEKRANDITENEWSKRLMKCIEHLYPDYEVVYSAEMGASFCCDHKYSGLNNIATFLDIFPFRGAPDIVIRRSHAIVLGGPTQQESSEDESLDVALQPASMKSVYDKVPEKLGQAISTLHFLLAAKAIRRMLKNSDKTTVTAHSVLLDKISGGINCKGQMTISSVDGECKRMLVEIDLPGGALMTEQTLCLNLQNLIEHHDT